MPSLLDHLTSKNHAAAADTRRLRGSPCAATGRLPWTSTCPPTSPTSKPTTRPWPDITDAPPLDRAATLGGDRGRADRLYAAGPRRGRCSGPIRTVADVVTEVRAFIAQCRADRCPALDADGAELRPPADGMIGRKLYRVQLTSAFSQAPAAVLRAAYERALDRKAAPDVVALEVIEHLADTRQSLAVTIEDCPAAQALRELVEAARDLASACWRARRRGPGRRPGPPPAARRRVEASPRSIPISTPTSAPPSMPRPR